MPSAAGGDGAGQDDTAKEVFELTDPRFGRKFGGRNIDANGARPFVIATEWLEAQGTVYRRSD